MSYSTSQIVTYQITGSAAHSRLAPLLPPDWQHSESGPVDFLWENAPRRETKLYRDSTRCYSHLPNGLAVLDSKWALARLLNNNLATNNRLPILQSHCFRGVAGFAQFCDKVDMFNNSCHADEVNNVTYHKLADLMDSAATNDVLPPAPSNWWVIKDDRSNGAGGIWMVSPDNAQRFLDPETTPLFPDHRYVAQEYVWPPVLYKHKKCHVRVYGLFTADGQAFVHQRCFLHVANHDFDGDGITSGDFFEPSVHITNCCANSHDPTKFSGEICADLRRETNGETQCGQPIISLATFFPSIAASVAHLAHQAMPFLRGGEANRGFEYLGMDFILSYSKDKQPIAYLLEVNSPPSQDTATGLSHAEDLHDDVIRDILSLWVVPSVQPHIPSRPGGWVRVHEDQDYDIIYSKMVPSKAVILNKIRWAIFDRKASKMEKDAEAQQSPQVHHPQHGKGTVLDADLIAKYSRTQFPYYNSAHSCTSSSQTIFFENAGGAQCPFAVLDAMAAALSHRNRSVIGSEIKSKARNTAFTLLSCSQREYQVFFDSNATSMLDRLANRMVQHSWIKAGHEIILATENHVANTTPWIQAAKTVGATIIWWPVSGIQLKDLLTVRTRLVVVSHASNILGQVRDLDHISKTVKSLCPEAQVVADGVATVPHVSANVSQIDWYVVSCHKLFGPHLGILCGRKSALRASFPDFSQEDISKLLELGTVNYEACAGLVGLGNYFAQLARFELDNVGSGEQLASQSSQSNQDRRQSCRRLLAELTAEDVQEAYRRIQVAEEQLVVHLLHRLKSSPKVTIVEAAETLYSRRLPIVAFHHSSISSSTIVEECDQFRISCRHGSFLSTREMQQELSFSNVVRFSLAHYNTDDEVDKVMNRLESLINWK